MDSGLLPRGLTRADVWGGLGKAEGQRSLFVFFFFLSFDHSIWTSSIHGISIFSTFLDVCMVDNFFFKIQINVFLLWLPFLSPLKGISYRTAL